MGVHFGGRRGIWQCVRPAKNAIRECLRPRSEALERRILFATRVWDGGSDVDANWATAANWAGDVAPVQGDDLVFPGGAARTTNTNNFADGTAFGLITFAGSGYVAGGNRIALQQGVTTTHAAGASALNTPLTFNAPAVFHATFAGTTLSLGGAINNNGHNLVTDGTGSVQVSGVVSGNGGVSKLGPGTLSLSGNNTYVGRTNVEAGFLAVTGFGTPLGSVAGGTFVKAGATLQTSGIVEIAEPLSIAGFGVGGDVPGNTNAALTVGGFATWTGQINLTADASIATVFTGNLTVATSPVVLGGHTLAVNSEGSATFNTPITNGLGGAGNLDVNRTRTGGTVTLTAANTYTGETRVLAGTLVLGDFVGPTLTAAGSLATDMVKVGAGGTFRIDNNSNPLNVDRLPDDTDIIMRGGTLEYLGSSAADTSETVDMIVLERGHSTIRTTPGLIRVGGANAVLLTASSLTRAAGATVDFAGGELGTTLNSVRFTTPPGTVGNGGGILPYATANQNDFATYDATLGVKPFANYAPSIAAAGPGDTVKLAAGEAVPANKTINALLLTAANISVTAVTLEPGVTLTLAAGALVSAGSGSASVGPAAAGVDSTLAFGREGIVTRNNAFAGGDLRIAAGIAGANGITLSGPAGLRLVPPAPTGNRYTGRTTINSGQVTIEANNNPFGGPGASTLDFYGGSLGVDVFVGPVTILNDVVLDDATATFHGLPDITFSGDVTIPRTSTLAPPGGFELTIDGRVSGTGALVVRAGSPGGGTVGLTDDDNNYSGGTLLVNNGIFRPTLLLGSSTVLGSGPLTLHQGTLQATRPVVLANQVRLDNADVTFGGGHPIVLHNQMHLNAVNTVATAVEAEIVGRTGSGALIKAGSGTLIVGTFPVSTGTTLVTGGTLLIDGAHGPIGVAAGTLGGTGYAEMIATAPAGTVNPGHPAAARGVLRGGDANFSNGGNLLIQVSGAGAAGVAYDALELIQHTLTAGGNSTLTVDLAGLSAPRTVNGVVRYSVRLGVPPRFGQVNVVNNPNAFTVQTDYTGGALNLLIGDAPPDRTPPAVTSAAFEFEGSAHRLRFTFSEDVESSLGQDDLAVRNVGSGQILPSDAFTVSYDPATHTARFTYNAGTGRLPDGNYTATLKGAGVSDAAGNAVESDRVVEFFSLTGDVNRDRMVNGTDFALLAQNFGRTGKTYAEGDLNGDGAVNGSDFALLAGSFGKTVPELQPMPAAVAPVKTITPAKAAAPAPARRHVSPAPAAKAPRRAPAAPRPAITRRPKLRLPSRPQA